MSDPSTSYGQAIAVIGMAGRFPGAPDLPAYWQVIEQGRDAITRGEALGATVPTGPALPPPEQFVAARGVLSGVEDFDASFWGYTPREAATLDPQHRLWLELSHQALESAGYARPGHNQIISVFAGSFLPSYLHGHLLPTRAHLEEFLRLQGAHTFALMVQNDPAFMPSRSAYKLNLRGPAINVQTGCSTSLVAIAQAVQSLLSYESDIALAGGACVALPQNCGYFRQDGAITSQDGYCRPYDAKACGTVFGSGGGAVVLKRLADAQRDLDPIHAVIRGAALNNDGNAKVSYLAPSVAGQAEVITLAQTLADVDPATIGYVEGHGTATPMGDPIEVEALTQAFRRKTDQVAFCCLGSAKGNVGHLDAAAGVAGFIRAVLALRHRTLPPTAHFHSPNPNLRLSATPFYVLSAARPWNEDRHPRRAAVSSFGIGGTNAHVILEEYVAAKAPASSGSGPMELRLSAKDPAALEAATQQLAQHLTANSDDLGTIADTLRHRREEHSFRRSVLVNDGADAVAALASADRWNTGQAFSARPKLVFAFPGQGSLRLPALAQLVAGDERFRQQLAALAKPASDLLSFDVLAFCTNPDAFPEALATDNARAQTVLYCVCVALARCLHDMGITPDTVLGHSVGEWPAAHLSGQVSAEDGLLAVFHRGRLMSTTGKGAALSVKATEEQLTPLLIDGVALAAVNGTNLCLVSGRPQAIEAMAPVLRAQKIRYAQVPIDVAVHSPFMDPAVEPFAAILAKLAWRAPTLPMLSSVTGAYFPADVETNQQYFSRQLRAQVRFDRTIATLASEPDLLVVEVGVANTLTTLLTAGFAGDPSKHKAIPLLPVTQDAQMGSGLARVPGLLWTYGVRAAETSPSRGAMDLPTYPFQRKRCWIDSPTTSQASPGGEAAPAATSGPTTAQTSLEKVVATIAEMSGIPAVSIQPDRTFSAFGFESIFIVQLADQLSHSAGCHVSPAAISEHNTATKLAAFLDRQGGWPAERTSAATEVNDTTRLTGRPFRGLCCLQKGDGRVPMLFIHGDRANDFLRQQVGAEQPLWGYVHQAADGEAFQYDTVEALANNCLFEWTAVNGDKPCVLAGHSYGGQIAYELARQLREHGVNVLHLFLIESIHPRVLRHLYGFGPKWPVTMARILRERAKDLRDVRRGDAYLRRGEKIPADLRTPYILAKYEFASARYFPGPLPDIDATVFSVTENLSDVPNNGYTQADLPKMKNLVIPGDHISIINEASLFEPVGREVAARLRELRQA